MKRACRWFGGRAYRECTARTELRRASTATEYFVRWRLLTTVAKATGCCCVKAADYVLLLRLLTTVVKAIDYCCYGYWLLLLRLLATVVNATDYVWASDYSVVRAIYQRGDTTHKCENDNNSNNKNRAREEALHNAICHGSTVHNWRCRSPPPLGWFFKLGCSTSKRVPIPSDAPSDSSRPDVSSADLLWHRHSSNCCCGDIDHGTSPHRAVIYTAVHGYIYIYTVSYTHLTLPTKA